jgi:hypothetical protein
MRTSVSITACAVGLASLVQYCPAPPLAAIIGITTGELVTAGTTLAGSAIAAGAGAGSKRDIPAGVSQESVDQCISSLAGVQINFVPQDDGKRIPDRLQILVAMLWCCDADGFKGLLVENMPAPCMNLATVITGDYNAGNPIPMSSSSILFRGLTQDQLQQIQDTLDSQ